jgi:hypothetical protein
MPTAFISIPSSAIKHLFNQAARFRLCNTVHYCLQTHRCFNKHSSDILPSTSPISLSHFPFKISSAPPLISSSDSDTWKVILVDVFAISTWPSPFQSIELERWAWVPNYENRSIVMLTLAFCQLLICHCMHAAHTTVAAAAFDTVPLVTLATTSGEGYLLYSPCFLFFPLASM